MLERIKGQKFLGKGSVLVSAVIEDKTGGTVIDFSYASGLLKGVRIF
ncbi:hypothetical protein H0X06_05375 [Candidatus Dependentiae bacterium]|nr:hypothetical protein [Candidatus Dependentiae bacterium]